MFPPEEGVWGNRLTRPPAPAGPLRRFGGSPIVNTDRSLGTLPLRGSGPNAFSFQTRIRAWPRGQHQVTHRSGEAERGGGSIYGDRCPRRDLPRLGCGRAPRSKAWVKVGLGGGCDSGWVRWTVAARGAGG